MKKHSSIKDKEITGSNLLKEIEDTMKTLLKPTKEHRAKVLEAVLGSRGVRQSIHHYKDNDVTHRLANGKLTQYSVYRKEMGPTIVPLARKAPHPYTYKRD